MKLLIVTVLVAIALAELRNPASNQAELPPFKLGQEYKYRFDSQIASGIAEISHQKALTRIQADVSLYFNTNRLVTLRLDNLRVGASNARLIQYADRIHPFSLVEEKEVDSDHLAKLKLPLQFNYVDGLIDNVNFHTEDDVWSKNVKRSILNLLQVNLKARNLLEEQKLEIPNQDPSWESLTQRSFVAPETTIEGECHATYSINRLDNLGKNDVDFFNVTKTINFKKCSKLADVYYGPQVQKRLSNQWSVPQISQDEQRLDRSTIVRHFIVGSPENFAIKKAEAVSQYVFKALNAEKETPMVSVVVNELTWVDVEKNPSNKPNALTENSEESILYSNEFDRDVKRYYMYGDEEYPQDGPFSKIQNKVELIKGVLRQIQKSLEDKKVGVEAEATVLLPRLVELLRTCSVHELTQILDQSGGRAEEIFLDSLSIAATRNTIYYLADNIIKGKISIPRAVQSLKALSGVPAPSDKQVQILTRLCKSEQAKQSEALRQSCWLTVGSLMGEFCETSKQNSYVINKKSTDEVCPKHVTDKFIETLLEEYQSANNRYEKILILKSAGNAGLRDIVPKLKKIIYNQKEDPLVRSQAIDSLRRLREEIPHKIKQILMPVFQNEQDLTEVRLHALSLVIQTIPDNAVLDQISYVLLRERSKNVKSFAYDLMKSYAKSPIAEEQKIANHLKAILRLAGITEKDEEKMHSSRAYHIPIYSNQENEGIFTNFESMFASDNAFPKKVSAGLDTFLNSIFEKNAIEVNVQQEDLERWYEKIVNAWFSDRSSKSSSHSQNELNSIFNSLNLKNRRDSQNGRKYTTPFGVLTLRLRDIDYAVLPLEEQIMPEFLQRIILDAKKPTIRDFEQPLSLLNGKLYSINTAWNFYERLTKIPTTAGIPLKLTVSSPALASIEVSGRLRSSGVAINIKPSMAASHLKKIEASFPIVNSGVENVVSVESNVPIDGEVIIESSDKTTAKITINMPKDNQRLLGFHSLPVTYTRDYDRETRVHKEPKVKTIQNELMKQQDQQVDVVMGKDTLGLPFRIHGHIHTPVKFSYNSIFDAYMTTENHIHVEYEPTAETASQLKLNLEGDLFRKFTSQHRPQFNSFYDKFDAEMENRYEFQEIDQDGRDDQKLVKIVDKYNDARNLYKHGLDAKFKTVGGRDEKNARLTIESVCDDKFGYCKTKIDIRRDPMLQGERREWKLYSEIQTLLPEYSVDYEQYQEKRNEKNQKLICSIDCQWGTDGQQHINVRLNGEQAKTQEWIEAEKAELEKRKNSEIREKTAFLNKYDISAEYKLEPTIKNVFARGLDYFKLANFLNTNTKHANGKSGRLVTALIVIDPISREHVNVSINTPSEKIRVNGITSPIKLSPFSLIRHPATSIKSTRQLFTSVVSRKDTPQECSIDGTKVNTFDDVTFKAPITKCYTVLAKDCNRDSRFAVLVKKTEGENKKLKIVGVNGNIIEIEPDSERDDQFRVNINGERNPVNEENWEEYGISKLDNMVIVENRDLTVRFNGRQAWIKISKLYKNNQCGICGHYDDDDENEFVQGNNEKTSDLREYYRSFTMKDEECKDDYEDTIRRNKFETVDSDEEYGRDSDSQEEDSEEPISKTQVIEYGHKICFSMKPIHECSRNRYPTAEKKDFKVQFACLPRDSFDAKRFLRQIKAKDTVEEVRDLAPSFAETIKTPTKCVKL